jgi:anti-sigma-K factor RskA
MNEKNSKTLRDALARLREYEAPASAWDAIAAGLEPVLADKLPTYAPAAGVWNAISRKMEQADETIAQRRMAKERSLPLRKLAGIAAAVTLLITVGLGLNYELQTRQTVSVAYSQEVAPAKNIADWELDEKSFNYAISEIEVRNEPALNTLGLELDELTEASNEIKAMLVSYGENDPSLTRQLGKIERDRSDVYRRIIVEL